MSSSKLMTEEKKLDQTLVSISVNDIEIQVPEGQLIVEAVKKLHIDIPIFCYHPRMKPVGMCRMCLVEVGMKGPDGSVRMMPKPQAACTLPASNGLVIYTDTEKVHKDRKGVLEFLLINHPLDCPVCDKGGECPLQNNTLFYGPSTSRYRETKRQAQKVFPLSKYVTLDMERCIQCGRCVRFTEEISGDHQLAFRFRGSEMIPTTFKLTDFDSKFSGNTIEICPVGALTNSTYRFKGRPWDIQTKPSVCTGCSNGCNIWMDYRSGKLLRINGRTNESINEEWTCDKGKFGSNPYNGQKRLTAPLVRKGNQLVESSWEEAYQEILKHFMTQEGKVALLTRGTVSNEAMYLAQKLFRGVFNTNNIDHRWTKYLQKSSERFEVMSNIPQIQTSIESFEKMKSVFVFGAHLADELPILYLRIRKSALNHGLRIVQANERMDELTDLSVIHKRYEKGAEKHVLIGIIKSIVENDKKELKEDLKIVQNIEWKDILSQTSWSKTDFKNITKELLEHASAIVLSKSILNKVDASTLNLLFVIAILTKSEFNLYGLQANGQGAADMGVLPDMLPGGVPISNHQQVKKLLSYYPKTFPMKQGLDTHGIVKNASKRKLNALWLVDADLKKHYCQPEEGLKAMEEVPFLVYQGTNETTAMHYASVVLPMSAPAEDKGTFTSMEKRVQEINQVLSKPDNAKSPARIFADLLLASGVHESYLNLHKVRDEIKDIHHAYTLLSDIDKHPSGISMLGENKTRDRAEDMDNLQSIISCNQQNHQKHDESISSEGDIS